MEELVKTIVTFLEFFILGLLGLVCLAIGWPELKEKFRKNVLDRTNELLLGRAVPKESSEGLKSRFAINLSVLTFVAFIAGVVINSTSFILLQNAHIQVIHATATECLKEQGQHQGIGLPDASFFARPFIFWGHLEPEFYDRYYESIRHEVVWQISSPSSQGTVDPLLKEIRLIRGAALFSFVIAIFLLLRAVLLKLRSKDWKRSAVFFSIFACLYVGAMSSYWNHEVRWHMDAWSLSIRDTGRGEFIFPTPQMKSKGQ